MKVVKILLFTLLGLFSQNLFCQIDPEVLVVVKDKFYYQDKIYTSKNIKEVLKTNEKAYEVYQQYDMIKWFGHAGLLGSGLIGFYGFKVSETITGITRINQIAFIGVVVILPVAVTLGVYSFSRKKLRDAAKVFNAENQPPKIGVRLMDLKLVGTSNKIGIVLNF